MFQIHPTLTDQNMDEMITVASDVLGRASR
jgi:hypothetical protein